MVHLARQGQPVRLCPFLDSGEKLTLSWPNPGQYVGAFFSAEPGAEQVLALSSLLYLISQYMVVVPLIPPPHREQDQLNQTKPKNK